MIKVGIIGPTNILKLSGITNKPKEFFLERAKLIGKTLAELNVEIWINSDQGMLSEIGSAYNECGGKKCVVLFPDKGIPWPKTHATPYLKNADEIRAEPDWFWANYNVTSKVDICMCVGLSAGTLSELAYIKWNYQFNCGIMKKLIVIKELIRDGRLPPEIDIEIEKITQYIDRVEDLKNALDIEQMA
jgi:hypothetical protein